MFGSGHNPMATIFSFLLSVGQTDFDCVIHLLMTQQKNGGGNKAIVREPI